MQRRKRSSGYLLCLLLFCAGVVSGQEQSLSRDEFMRIVRSYHPLVRQADINVNKAEAAIQASRGAFDPLVAASVREKELVGKKYYSYMNTEVTIPTWYGLDVKAGTDRATGSRIDPEYTDGDIAYLGVKFSINSLVYDKRRQALQQAALMRTASEAERQLAVNNLLYDALAAFWSWVRDYELYKVVTEQLGRTGERLQMVKGEVQQGARAAIDTMEAAAQLYTLQQQQKNAEQNWKNASLELSSYLWLENGQPYTLPAPVVPAPVAQVALTERLPDLDEALNALAVHPKLRVIDTKLDILDLERRLKIQNFVPKLSVNAAALNYLSYGKNTLLPPVGDNYKVSLDVNVPLFMRTARGELRGANLKINEFQIEKMFVHNQLDVKVRTYYNEYRSLTGQVADMANAQAAYTTLYNGEFLKFRTGESTLFLVNARELKLLETTQKLIELNAKLQKSYTGILYAAGMLL